MLRPPLPRLETERLLLRCRTPEDAATLREAIVLSLPELQRWMHWAADEPSTVAEYARRIEKSRVEFDAGIDWHYGIFPPDEGRLLGVVGFHPTPAPGCYEIGYWLRTDETDRGIATEAVRAVTAHAFDWCGVARIEIRCDPNNVRSAAIPRRCGYAHRETLPNDTTTPQGGPRDTMVWEMTSASWARLTGVAPLTEPRG